MCGSRTVLSSNTTATNQKHGKAIQFRTWRSLRIDIHQKVCWYGLDRGRKILLYYFFWTLDCKMDITTGTFKIDQLVLLELMKRLSPMHLYSTWMLLNQYNSIVTVAVQTKYVFFKSYSCVIMAQFVSLLNNISCIQFK